MEKRDNKVYLGIDFSTQQGKVTAVDEKLTIVYEDHISFDDDLPEFGTVGGVHTHEDNVKVTAPLAMVPKALDMLLDRMARAGFDFGRVVGIAGDAQAFAVVYWRNGARQILNNLDSNKSFYSQLKDIFTIPDIDSWLDSSANKQCLKLEEAVGGPLVLANLTGSRAHPASGGAHIMKIYQNQKEIYDNTEKISLLSSFVASLFIGDYAPTEFGDGSSMNLLDIRTKEWSPKCLDACAANLSSKLGPPDATHKILGSVSSYLVKKYKFSSDCKVCPFTIDGLQSLIGLATGLNETIMGLGTGDWMAQWLQSPCLNMFGYELVSALDSDIYNTAVLFRNGSLMRQHVMERCAGSWQSFEELFFSTPPGNNGNLGMYFDVTELHPAVSGTFRFNKNDEKVETFPPEVEIRSLLEGQFLARRMYAEKCGIFTGKETRILLTGGASISKAVQQVIADIFNKPVYTIDVPNSAPLGGCYRAKLALEGLNDLGTLGALTKPECVATPTPGIGKIYDVMLDRYGKLENQLAAKCGVSITTD